MRGRPTAAGGIVIGVGASSLDSTQSPKAANPGQAPVVAAEDAVAAGVLRDFLALLEEEEARGVRDTRGLSKHLVVMAFVHADLTGSSMDHSLRTMAEHYALAQPRRRGSMKKCVSHARALHERYGYGLKELGTLPKSSAAAFQELDGFVAGWSLNEALVERASRLSGSRGGRRTTHGRRSVLASMPPEASEAAIGAYIDALFERADRGEADASVAIDQLLAKIDRLKRR